MLRKINLLCVGSLKNIYLNNLYNKYNLFINIISIKQSNINTESEQIISIIKKSPKNNCVLFDLNGKEITKEYFNKSIFNFLNDDIYFIIGGSNGVSENVKQRCGLSIKLSDFTYTYQLFRVLAVLFIHSIKDLR